ncbi:MAG: adenosine deaminase, partial [Frankiales bacterium]|nr:adenosine deaminase [Frankiales bacterium]
VELGARRLGHGVRAVEDPALLEELAALGVTCEVCPASNASLGVLDLDRAPVRVLRQAGVGVALGADDPLLFRSGLVAQYEALRERQGLSDDELADLARCSVTASAAPDDVRARLLAGVEAWLEPLKRAR